MECPFCGCTKIEKGALTTPYGLVFKADSSRIFNSKESPVAATVCLSCGRIFDLRVKNIDKFYK